MAQSIFKFYKQHIYNPSRHISLPSIALILIGITCFILIREFTWQGKSGNDYEQIISGDGKGYYMYLPNIFFNKTISIVILHYGICFGWVESNSNLPVSFQYHFILRYEF